MRQILILIFLLAPVTVFSQVKTYFVDTVLIKSGILHENRSIIVFRPIDITRTDPVNFIYLTDGEYSDHRFQKIKEHFKDTVHNIIAIGIVNTDRRRDLLYAMGAGRFLDFITDELIPVIEKDYETKNRILFGHSFGGGFTIFALLNKPDYFNTYIASSPTPIMDLIKKENYQHVDTIIKNNVFLDFSCGSKDMGQVRKWSRRLKDNLDGLHFEKFEWRFSVFEGKNHNNSDLAALISGLHNMK